jgi:hypothetical protein
MWKTLMLIIAVVAFMSKVGECQDAKTVLEGMAKSMGATDLKSIQYSGSGSIFAVGQNPNPTAPWPRFNVKISPAIPQPVAVADHLHQLWIMPYGVIKAALAHNATVQSRSEGDKKLITIAFTVPSQLKVSANINDRNLVEKVESWIANPVVGDMQVETIYSDYRDFNLNEIVGGILAFPT